MSDFVREKPIVALVFMLLVGVAIGFMQKNAIREERTSLVQEVTRGLTLPFSLGARGLVLVGSEVKNTARPRSKILKENANLRKQVKDLSLENMQLRAKAFENLELRKELGLKELSQLKMISAEVVARKESSWFDTATINAGRNRNVQTASAVVNHLGLIGQVHVVNKFSSEIVALTSPGSAVGAMVERSRHAGIVQGTGFDYLVLAYMSKDADVKIGDRIVTSGMGKVMPKGFQIGTVVEVNRSAISMTTNAKVLPSVSFDKLEQVFVVEREGIGNER